MFPDDDNWKLFRTIEAAPAGTFAADGDWAGGDAFALTLENGIISIPRDHDHQVVDLGTVILYAVVTTADRAAIVARANMTFNVQAVELVQPEFTRMSAVPRQVRVLPVHYVDSGEYASRPQRKIVISGRGIRQMAIRVYGFANVPGTAEELHLCYRLE